MELDLVTLMRAAWVIVTVPIVIASISSSKLSSFQTRFLSRCRTMLLSCYKSTVPLSFFSHFYVVAVLWTTLLVLTTWLYACRMAPLFSESFQVSHLASQLAGGSHIFSFHKSNLVPLEHRYRVWRTVLLLLLMEAQFVRRLFETCHISNYSLSARMHIFTYLTGLFYHIATPLSLCCTCAPEVLNFILNLVFEFIVKGKNQMPAIETDWWESVNIVLMKLGWLQWIGSAIFLWGWIHQFHHHAFLGALNALVEHCGGYVSGTGDWFDFDIISSPNPEIVMHAGLVVASGGGDLTVWLLLLFVVAKSRACSRTHNWHIGKFENYPRNLFSFIPLDF